MRMHFAHMIAHSLSFFCAGTPISSKVLGPFPGLPAGGAVDVCVTGLGAGELSTLGGREPLVSGVLPSEGLEPGREAGVGILPPEGLSKFGIVSEC